MGTEQKVGLLLLAVFCFGFLVYSGAAVPRGQTTPTIAPPPPVEPPKPEVPLAPKPCAVTLVGKEVKRNPYAGLDFHVTFRNAATVPVTAVNATAFFVDDFGQSHIGGRQEYRLLSTVDAALEPGRSHSVRFAHYGDTKVQYMCIDLVKYADGSEWPRDYMVPMK
jgi:hypothetical protein